MLMSWKSYAWDVKVCFVAQVSGLLASKIFNISYHVGLLFSVVSEAIASEPGVLGL